MTIYEILSTVFAGLALICVFFLIYTCIGHTTKTKEIMQPVVVFTGLAFAITAEVFYIIDLWKMI